MNKYAVSLVYGEVEYGGFFESNNAVINNILVLVAAEDEISAIGIAKEKYGVTQSGNLVSQRVLKVS